MTGAADSIAVTLTHDLLADRCLRLESGLTVLLVSDHYRPGDDIADEGGSKPLKLE